MMNNAWGGVVILFTVFMIFLAVPSVHSQSANTTMQVKIILNDTAANQYIPGAGEFSIVSLPVNTYTSPPHFYLSSYLNNVMVSLVYAYQNPISISTDKDGGTYTFGNSLNFSNSIVFLVFSAGTWKAVDNRIEMIEKGEFLTKPKPSFSYGLGDKYELKVMLPLKTMNITSGNQLLQSGYYKMIIENKGKMGGKDTISVGTV
ncbi:MAG: hypothetical protein JW754_05195 [Candidatus Aenigmarchaeota archaeon]|nr:hypothetical protein [Candidatus Aenigmarchaeota archaeon]